MDFLRHFGYLDPGTGSIIIQSVIGLGAGVVLFGRRAIGRAGRKAKNLLAKSDAEKK